MGFYSLDWTMGEAVYDGGALLLLPVAVLWWPCYCYCYCYRYCCPWWCCGGPATATATATAAHGGVVAALLLLLLLVVVLWRPCYCYCCYYCYCCPWRCCGSPPPLSCPCCLPEPSLGSALPSPPPPPPLQDLQMCEESGRDLATAVKKKIKSRELAALTGRGRGRGGGATF